MDGARSNDDADDGTSICKDADPTVWSGRDEDEIMVCTYGSRSRTVNGGGPSAEYAEKVKTPGMPPIERIDDGESSCRPANICFPN